MSSDREDLLLSPQKCVTDSPGAGAVPKTPQQGFRARKGGPAGVTAGAGGKRLDYTGNSSTGGFPQAQAKSSESPEIAPVPDSPATMALNGSRKEISSMGEQELSNMLLPPTSAQVQVNEVKAEAGEEVIDPVEEEQTTLIPREIPSSKLLYVLTTAEGRDKLMKTVQYLSKLCICVLKAESIVPMAARAGLHEWCLKLANIVQATREGRAMFKIGRWIITVFHVEVAVSLLLSKAFPLLALRARVRAVRNDAEEPSRRASCLQLAKEAILGWREKKRQRGGVDERFDFCEETKRRAKHQYDNFTYLEIFSMVVRCCLSVFRNLIRDRLFIQSQRLLGAPAMGPETKLSLQGLENKMWFVIGCLDLVMNSGRLLDWGWWHASDPDAVVECKCTQEMREDRDAQRSQYAALSFINKKDNCFFPGADIDVGCPAPSAPSFFEAARPRDMPLICSACHSICATQSTPQGSLAERPSLAASLTNRVSKRNSTPPTASPAPSGAPVVMGLPGVIRRLNAIWWCMTEHSNLKNTLLLELRYMCDVYLSIGYVFGNLARGRTTHGLVTSNPLQQHLHSTANIAGLISGLVSLHRVHLSASSL